MLNLNSTLQGLFLTLCTLFVTQSVRADTPSERFSLKVSQGHVGSEGIVVRVTLRGAEGQEQFIFRRRKDLDGKTSFGTRLYAGKIREHGAQKSHPRGAALDLIGNTVTLRFPGRTRRAGSRMYAVRGSLSNESTSHTITRLRISRASRSGGGTCADHDHTAESALASDQRSNIPAGQFAPAPIQTRVIEIATLADYEMHALYGAQTNDTILAFLNAAESIYLNQLGITFSVTKQVAFQSAGSPLRSTAPIDLLNDFSTYSVSSQFLGKADVYHLFSGKRFTGDEVDTQIVGLAYKGVVCRYDSEASYGLSRLYNEALAPLVAAHEIGHNLGASHDVQSSSLMSPFVTPSNNYFSDQSLGEITAHLAKYGSCLSQGSAVLPLQVDLESSLRGKRTLTLAINANGDNVDECSVTIYGASTRTALEPDIIEFADTIVSMDLTPVGQITLSAKLSRSLRKRKKIFFRAVMSCPSQTILSGIDPLTVRVSAAKSLNTEKWLSYLSRQFGRAR